MRYTGASAHCAPASSAPTGGGSAGRGGRGFSGLSGFSAFGGFGGAINAAYAMKQDATTGSLEAGKRADLVVLDRDILSVDPETIADTKVLATYLDGQLVYSAPAGDGTGSAASDEDEGAWWNGREGRMRDWLRRD